MRPIALAAALLAATLAPHLHAAEPSPALIERLRTEEPPERPIARPGTMWKMSLAALAVSAAADALSSYGKRELNPVLSSRDGRFGGRGIAIKSLVTGSAIAGQWFLVRRAPETGRLAAIANFGMAGVFTAASVHNSRNRRQAVMEGMPLVPAVPVPADR
ncbi:MAG: hypothetical protein IT163_09575 [Bryobacterales bacterium]|nr:hypothetical protein [Bryobacterales bacterium]